MGHLDMAVASCTLSFFTCTSSFFKNTAFHNLHWVAHSNNEEAKEKPIQRFWSLGKLCLIFYEAQ